MTSDTSSDKRAPEREPRKGMHSIPASPQGGAPNLTQGLELPRSSDC